MDLNRFATIIQRWAARIVLLSLTASVAAFVASQYLPREYEAEARLLVGSLTETSTDQLLAYQQLAQTYAEVATSTPIIARVATRLGLGEDAQQVLDRLDVRALTGQSVIRIVASASSAEAAARLANAIADEIVDLAKPPTLGATSLATTYQPAIVPERPATPRTLLNTAVGAVLGLAIGIALALFSEERRAARAQAVVQARAGS